MDRIAAPAPLDAGFTLDATLLAQRKTQSARRVHAVQIPAIRAAGFAIVCLLTLIHDMQTGGTPGAPGLLALTAINLSYAAASWLVLHRYYGRSGRFDLALLFLHLDVPIWLISLHHLEASSLYFAYFLLVRVSDQTGFGVRRAIYFSHAIVVAYLAYSLGVWAWTGADAQITQRLGIAAIMYLVGCYLAFTGGVTERLRLRMRQAVRTARELVDRLDHETQALEAQATELDAARHDAEQASLAKSQFLAMISHEIRTPMNGVLGTTELLLGTALTPTQQRYARTAHTSGLALLALIDDVLDLSRIEAGKLTLSPTGTDVRALVTDAVSLMAATGRDKPVALSATIAPGLPGRLMADPVRLRQLLVNLLHNAIKFTERGSVRLDVSILFETPDAVHLRFEVRDTGIGIAGDQIDSVFDAFMQADPSSTRRHGGSGLGLAIVKELAELMGGRVDVESQLGVGSVFWVEIALQRAPEAAARVKPAPAEPGRLGAHVLLAEDDAVNQLVIRETLHVLGCQVDVVSDGEAAWRAVGRKRYDLVFMDCHMPGMDGFEATQRIRDDELARGIRTPIVALTADALAGDRERCIRLGMDDYLTKPASSARLAEAVRRWSAR